GFGFDEPVSAGGRFRGFHRVELARRAGGGQRKLRNIALSRCDQFGAFSAMEATEAEKKQGRRVQRLLYSLVVIMIGVPVIIYLMRQP
ncbi:MAG: hypothetical protein Q7R41_11730, partial [Phycisphaerales bacterium]|nr:hypothetical protein [Phycisphaerales bacterium]